MNFKKSTKDDAIVLLGNTFGTPTLWTKLLQLTISFAGNDDDKKLQLQLSLMQIEVERLTILNVSFHAKVWVFAKTSGRNLDFLLLSQVMCF